VGVYLGDLLLANNELVTWPACVAWVLGWAFRVATHGGHFRLESVAGAAIRGFDATMDRPVA